MSDAGLSSGETSNFKALHMGTAGNIGEGAPLSIGHVAKDTA